MYMNSLELDGAMSKIRLTGVDNKSALETT